MQQFRLQEEIEMMEVEQAALESNPNEISSSNMNLERSKDRSSLNNSSAPLAVKKGKKKKKKK